MSLAFLFPPLFKKQMKLTFSAYSQKKRIYRTFEALLSSLAALILLHSRCSDTRLCLWKRFRNTRQSRRLQVRQLHSFIHYCLHEGIVGSKIDDVSLHVMEHRIPGWPSLPKTLAEAAPSWLSRLLPHVLLLLVPTASIGRLTITLVVHHVQANTRNC